jgi:hypothetical protein
MGQLQGERRAGELPRCSLCDDVLGVYEPIMHVIGGDAGLTSRAAEPGVPSVKGDCYHLDCYERLVGES